MIETLYYPKNGFVKIIDNSHVIKELTISNLNKGLDISQSPIKVDSLRTILMSSSTKDNVPLILSKKTVQYINTDKILETKDLTASGWYGPATGTLSVGSIFTEHSESTSPYKRIKVTLYPGQKISYLGDSGARARGVMCVSKSDNKVLAITAENTLYKTAWTWTATQECWCYINWHSDVRTKTAYTFRVTIDNGDINSLLSEKFPNSCIKLLEKLSFNGTSNYIRLNGVHLSSESTVECKFQLQDAKGASGKYCLWYCRKEGGKGNSFMGVSANNAWRFDYNKAGTNTGTCDTNINIAKAVKNKLYLNNTLIITQTAATFSETVDTFIGNNASNNTISTSWLQGDIYYFKVDSMEFLPAQIGDKVGLVNLATLEFYEMN